MDRHKGKRVDIWLEDDAFATLEKLVEQSGASRSKVVRELILGNTTVDTPMIKPAPIKSRITGQWSQPAPKSGAKK